MKTVSKSESDLAKTEAKIGITAMAVRCRRQCESSF
jgi:hypothetical protein